jgi:hypothetical protein
MRLPIGSEIDREPNKKACNHRKVNADHENQPNSCRKSRESGNEKAENRPEQDELSFSRKDII